MSCWSRGAGTLGEAIAACMEPILDAAVEQVQGGQLRWHVESDYKTYIEIRFEPPQTGIEPK